MTGQIRGTVDQVNETGDTTIPDVAFTFTGGMWHFNMDTRQSGPRAIPIRFALTWRPAQALRLPVGVK